MPKRKRVQREHTEDWQTIQQYTFWPEQTAYELLRPVVLFGDPAIQRAQETGEPRTSLERIADTFDEQGMVSLFASRPRKQPQETARSLPPDMRQLIVDLRVEMPNMSIREIAEICDTRFHRRPSHHSIKIVLASGPPPSIQMRRFPLFDDTPDPAQRRHNIVQLHAEGWSVASIAEYLGVSKQTVYTTLKRWWQEGVKGLDDKSHARKAPRKVTLEVANEIRKKQENPLIGEWRMHAVLLQEGIKLSPRTCGRIMAKNRAIYGWDKPKAPPKPKKEMPFKAARRHEYWSIDIRYIEHHQLPDIKGPVYVISILENFSRMRNYGAPEAIVTDSGGVFYSKRAMAIYEALDIRKERIDPRQSWQNYIEAHLYVIWNLNGSENCQITCIMWNWDDQREGQFHIIGIMRRLADYYLNKAPTLDEMKKAHRKFIRDYNTQIHGCRTGSVMTIAIVPRMYCVVYWRVLCLHQHWPASSLRQNLPVTWIDQDISAFVGGASMQKLG